MSRRTPKPEAPLRSPLALSPAARARYAPAAGPDGRLEREVLRVAEEQAPRLGLSRRAFLEGPCGLAAALLVANALSGCRPYKVDRAAAKDPDAAKEQLGGEAFVFDAQTHHVESDPEAVWTRNNPFYASMFERINASHECGARSRFGCLSRDAYVHEIFEWGGTNAAVLSGVPALVGKSPLHNDEIAATRDHVNSEAGARRVLAAGLVLPDAGQRELDGMYDLAARMKVVAWTAYTAFGLRGYGWWLDDPAVGTPFLEQARAMKVPRVLCPKGLPWPNFDKAHASPRDIGPAAKAFPDVQLVVYHSGYETDAAEGPYDPYSAPQTADVGVNRLLKSLEESGIWPNSNVWAELGGTWMLLMGKPVEAAHVVGKLLKHVGEDRVLWGTDALFTGSPKPQLEAFRAFQIPEELQEKHGYPALTPAIKAKILGLNAAKLFGTAPRTKLPAESAPPAKKSSERGGQSVSPGAGTLGRRELLGGSTGAPGRSG